MSSKYTDRLNLKFISSIITDLNNVTMSEAVLICDKDGHLITVSDNCTVADINTVTALVATATGVSRRIGLSLNFGDDMELILKGTKGMLLAKNITDELFIGVIAAKDANLAMINLQTKQAIAQLKDKVL